MKKRILAVLLVAGLLFSTASCSEAHLEETGVSEAVSDEYVTDTVLEEVTSLEIVTEESEKRVSDEALAAIPAFDFMGDNVIIVSTYNHTILPEDTEKLINRKRYERMNYLEEKHNFKFVKRTINDNTAFREARDAYNADLYFSDLMYISPSELWRYENAGMTVNLNSLPFVNLDADYYDKESMDAASINGNVFAAIGDSNIDYDNLPCVFFNKDILGETDIYSEVYSQSWTVSRLTALSKAATSINGTVTDYTAERLVDNLYYSACGINVEKEADNIPVYIPFNSTAQECVDLIYSLIYGGNGYRRNNNARDIFENGNSLFLISTLSEKNNLINSDFEWGILPLPLMYEFDEYKTLKDEDFPITVVLANTPDTRRCGVLLESINAAMHGYISEAYYDECMYEIVRDNDTLNMISIIEEAAKCDFAHMFGGGINRLDECTYEAVYSSVTTARNLEYYNNRGANINDSIGAHFEE